MRRTGREGCRAVALVYFFFQVEVWRKQGFDVTLEVLNLIITGAMWAVLFWAILRWRSRTAQVGAAMTTLRDDCQVRLENAHRERNRQIEARDKLWADRLSQERAQWREMAAAEVGKRDQQIKALADELVREREGEQY